MQLKSTALRAGGAARHAPGARMGSPSLWQPSAPPQQRRRRGRPPKAAAPHVAVRSRLGGPPEARRPSADAPGGTVLATTLRSEAGTAVARRQAYQEHPRTVDPGLRWRQPPAALRPVWREKPARIAALALLTGVGVLVEAVIPRPGRLSRRDHAQHVPGNKGPTATPTAAVVFALFAPVTLVQFAVGKTTSHQVHGIQDNHLLVCEAVGIDPAWYHGGATEQNSRPRTTPP